MKEFEFTLKFSLANSDTDPEIYVEILLEAGCDDALIGIGKQGRIALDFCREGITAKDAVLSAIKDVQSVIPDAKLIDKKELFHLIEQELDSPSKYGSAETKGERVFFSPEKESAIDDSIKLAKCDTVVL